MQLGRGKERKLTSERTMVAKKVKDIQTHPCHFIPFHTIHVSFITIFSTEPEFAFIQSSDNLFKRKNSTVTFCLTTKRTTKYESNGKRAKPTKKQPKGHHREPKHFFALARQLPKYLKQATQEKKNETNINDVKKPWATCCNLKLIPSTNLCVTRIYVHVVVMKE